jgi:DNA-binding MarR family transcriptional regulator
VEQFPVLMTVSALKSVSQREIADITMRDKSSIQRSVTTLLRKGLIDVVQDGDDKRKHVVTLTSAGNALAKKVRSILRQSEDVVFSHMTGDEKDNAIQSAKTLADQLDRL